MEELTADEGTPRDDTSHTFGACTACDRVYPLSRTDDGWRPVGTDGTCRCGHDRIEPVRTA